MLKISSAREFEAKKPKMTMTMTNQSRPIRPVFLIPPIP
jgi:hypothetical protein